VITKSDHYMLLELSCVCNWRSIH